MRDREARSRPMAKRLRSEMSKPEVVLWTQLRRNDRHAEKFRRQHPIGPYVGDFAHLRTKLVIELDGATHSSDIEIRHDAIRTAYLVERGWRVIRFTNDDVYNSVENVVDAILLLLPPPVPAGPPPP